MYHGRIKKVEGRWPEEDFGLFWRMRQAYLPQWLRLEDSPNDPGVKPEKQNHYRLTGTPIMMDKDWPCFKNDFNDELEAANGK